MTTLGPMVFSTAVSIGHGQTPARLFVPEILSSKAACLLKALDEISVNTGQNVEGCYSVKTNSDRRVLEDLRSREMLFDVISVLELNKCLALNIEPRRLISNGPGKWWPTAEIPPGCPRFHTINCDSVGDLRQTIELMNSGLIDSATLGLRLSPVGIPSRFGIACDTEADLRLVRSAVDQIRATGLDIGLQCHMAAHKLGRERWTQVMSTTFLRVLFEVGNLGFNVAQIDLGGGWPAEWLEDDEFANSVVDVMSSLHNSVSAGIRYVVEPGRLLVQPSMVLVTRVLTVRGKDSSVELVVDGSVADLPTTSARLRDIWWRPSSGGVETWRAFNGGTGLILGRLCMERDILASDVHIPADINEGDVIVFSDAGGYDSSMAYSAFGT